MSASVGRSWGRAGRLTPAGCRYVCTGLQDGLKSFEALESDPRRRSHRYIVDTSMIFKVKGEVQGYLGTAIVAETKTLQFKSSVLIIDISPMLSRLWLGYVAMRCTSCMIRMFSDNHHLVNQNSNRNWYMQKLCIRIIIKIPSDSGFGSLRVYNSSRESVEINSTSKTRADFGGMMDPKPVSPVGHPNFSSAERQGKRIYRRPGRPG